MFFWDPTMVLLIPGIILGLYAQAKVSSAFKKYSQVPASSGMTGAEAAQKVLESQGIYDVEIEPIAGQLSDHYDPRTKKLRLSEGVYAGRSLAAVGVAAHEAGHAVQHATDYMPMVVRTGFVPLASFGSVAWIFIFFGGLLFGMPILLKAGIILFTFVVAFQLVTLPVELNASNRALAMLTSSGVIYQDEIYGAKKVLNAAALTYVAGLVMAVLQLLRLLMLAGMMGGSDE